MLYGFRKPTARRLKDISAKKTATSHVKAPMLPYQCALFIVEGTVAARTGSSSPWTPGTGTGRLLRFSVDDKVGEDSTALLSPLYNMTLRTLNDGDIVGAQMVDGHWTVTDSSAESVVPFTLTSDLAGSYLATATATIFMDSIVVYKHRDISHILRGIRLRYASSRWQLLHYPCQSAIAACASSTDY